MRTRALASALVVAAACGESTPPVLTVGPVSYSERDLLGLTDARRQTLAELTALALAVADSSTAALGAPLLVERIDDRLLEILAADLTLERNGVSDEVLQARYGADPEWELTVRHMLVFSERWRSAAHREASASKAARALDALRAGAAFEDVEAALAPEPGGDAREGLLPPGREGAWVPEFWAAAIALEPGGLSPVTETQYGYHVLRLEDRRRVPFEEARSSVARAVATRIENPRAVLDAWMAAAGSDPGARRAAALAEARRRGLELPPPERAELLREWDAQVTAWAAALGFRFGLAADEVARAALSALASPGQGADIARAELSRHASLLAARYQIRFGAGTR